MVHSIALNSTATDPDCHYSMTGDYPAKHSKRSKTEFLTNNRNGRVIHYGRSEMLTNTVCGSLLLLLF